MKLLSALLFATLGLCIATPGMAQSSGTTTKHVTKSAAKKKAQPKKAEPEVIGDDDDDDKSLDIGTSTAVEYSCELGNKLTIYSNASDDKHIALRLNKQIFRMHRVPTTTGANRFENTRRGWVWIGIPAKGILLDSKNGHELANECKNADQLKAKTE
jgi:hypothetical protein